MGKRRAENEIHLNKKPPLNIDYCTHSHLHDICNMITRSVLFDFQQLCLMRCKAYIRHMTICFFTIILRLSNQ